MSDLPVDAVIEQVRDDLAEYQRLRGVPGDVAYAERARKARCIVNALPSLLGELARLRGVKEAAMCGTTPARAAEMWRECGAGIDAVALNVSDGARGAPVFRAACESVAAALTPAPAEENK